MQEVERAPTVAPATATCEQTSAHFSVMQSPSSRHVRSTAQRSEHVSPPQSTSVSRPFLLWSTQETQLPSKHLPLAQSNPIYCGKR